jgi:hypothetical protein
MTVIVYADQSLPPTVGDVISGVQCLHLVAADMRPFVGPSGFDRCCRKRFFWQVNQIFQHRRYSTPSGRRALVTRFKRT